MQYTDTFDPETVGFFEQHPDPKVRGLLRPWMRDIQLKQISSLEELEELLDRARHTKILAWDVETRSLEATIDNVVGHCISIDEHAGYYIPVAHRVPEDLEVDPNLDPQTVWDLIWETIDVPGMHVFVYNWKFEGRIVRSAKQLLPTFDWTSQQLKVHDVLIYRWLYKTTSEAMDLKSSTKQFLDIDMHTIKEVPGVVQRVKSKSQVNFGNSDPRLATVYAAADPVCTFRLFKHFLKASDKRFTPGAPNNLCSILNLEHQTLDALFLMEEPVNGERPVRIDRAFLQHADKDLTDWLQTVMYQIFKEVGTGEFNINSPAQVAATLTRMADIKFKLTTVGNPVTNEAALKEIAARDNDTEDERIRRAARVCRQILVHRGYTKQRSTYVRSLLKGTVDSPSARLLFRSVNTSTGRFSGGKPDKGDPWYTQFNAQNVPNAAKFRSYPCKKVFNPEALTELVEYTAAAGRSILEP